MNDFYEVLDLLYKANIKYPQLRFGQLMTWCVANEEKFAYISDDEFKKRLEDLLKEENL